MKLYIGNTDTEWFEFHRKHDSRSVNFWRPMNTNNFRVLNPGDPFLFRRKAPVRAIAGFAFFSRHLILPLSVAWQNFGTDNGFRSFADFRNAILSIRKSRGRYESNDPVIGCTILDDPIYFEDGNFVTIPPEIGYKDNVVQGKSVDMYSVAGKDLWERLLLPRLEMKEVQRNGEKDLVLNEPEYYQTSYKSRIRIGQSGFRARVMDAYGKRCAITGESNQVVLDAAHICDYAAGGPNVASNGLLLRTDLHRLFDTGYLSLDNDLRIICSPLLKSRFPESRAYLDLAGKAIRLPKEFVMQPGLQFVQWHRENQFLKAL